MQGGNNDRARAGRGWLAVATFLAVLAARPLWAAPDDTARMDALERRLDASMKLIRELSQRVEQLQKQLAHQGIANSAGPSGASPNAGTAAAPSPDEQRISAVEQSVQQIALSTSDRAAASGLPLHGFADVDAGTHNPTFPNLKGADIGSMEFFLTPRLGDRTRALFELNFEVDSSGDVGVDLERAQIGYQLADSTTVWLGRFHTPYGFWNTAFHHGLQIATSLRRPAFLEFEDHGGIMPAHTVGAWLTSAQRIGDGRLTYDVYVGNNQRIRGGMLDMNSAGSAHGGAIVGGNLGWLFGGALDGLKVGVDALSSRIEDVDTTPTIVTRLRSYGTYLAYDTDRWEHIAEFHLFSNYGLQPAGATYHSHAGFVQLGYRMPDRFTLYTRYERTVLQQADNYFQALNTGRSYHREALGLRYDLDLASALKMELATTRFTDRTPMSYDEALLQYAIRF